jgi:hypothetical protein
MVSLCVLPWSVVCTFRSHCLYFPQLTIFLLPINRTFKNEHVYLPSSTRVLITLCFLYFTLDDCIVCLALQVEYALLGTEQWYFANLICSWTKTLHSRWHFVYFLHFYWFSYFPSTLWETWHFRIWTLVLYGINTRTSLSHSSALPSWWICQLFKLFMSKLYF